MAQLELELGDGVYQGAILGERFEFPANPENTYCVIQFLRAFKKPSGKQGVFSQEQIAQAIPDFEGKTRQSIDDHVRRFRESGGNLQHYVTRQRQVDATVVDAVRAEVLECPLRQTVDVVTAVNQRLNRQDLNAANISAAFEAISLVEVRPVLRRQLEQGRLTLSLGDDDADAVAGGGRVGRSLSSGGVRNERLNARWRGAVTDPGCASS